MDIRCPYCKTPRGGSLGSYLQPWNPVECGQCGKSSAAGSWEQENEEPLGDPFEPDTDYRYKPPTVFVSYTHADHAHPTFKQLNDDLMFRAKVNVWIDSQQVKPGESIARVVEDGIASSDYFLYVISKHTAQAGWALREFELAYSLQERERKLRIIPVLVDPVSVSFPISGLKYIDLTTNYENGYRSLCIALGLGYSEQMGVLDLGNLEPSTGVIEVCRFFDERYLEALRKNPNDMRHLSSRDFEKLVAEIFDGFGYEVELTKRTRDGGRDIIAIKRAEVDLRFLIECKHPDTRKHIGVGPVRELLGVKADEGASKAILATTAYFSKDAKLYFERHPWDLEGRDFEGIMEWLERYSMLRH